MSPEELADLLVCQQENREELLENWQQLIKEHLDHAIATLNKLVDREDWLADAWTYTIRGFRDEERPVNYRPGWDSMSWFLIQMPEATFEHCCREIASWLYVASKILPEDLERRYWALWDRTWPASQKVGEDIEDRVLTQAINHPSGQLVETLLQRLFDQQPNAGDRLPSNFQNR